MNYYDELRRELNKIEGRAFLSNEEKLDKLINIVDSLIRTLDEQAKDAE